LYLLK